MKLNHRIARGQGGSVLIISLIMLLVLTMLGIAAIRLGITNLLATNNMQVRQEAQAAAEEAINKQVLSINFLNNANIDAALNAIQNTPYTYSAGSKDYTVTLSRPCLKSLSHILTTDPTLDFLVAYKDCVFQEQSMCYRALWEVKATVVNGFLGARTDVVQGFQMVVGMKNTVNVGSATGPYYCPPM